MTDSAFFSDYGIELIRRGDRIFIRYDSGGMVVHMREAEISEAEARQAQSSEHDAYLVLLAVQRRTGLA